MKKYLQIILLFTFFYASAQENQDHNMDCSWSYNKVDEYTGKTSRALSPVKLFGYTPESQSRFFVDNEYIECYANISENDNKMLLHLKIIYQDLMAEEQVGGIEAGATISIRQIKGSPITLSTTKGSTIQKKDGFTIFECNFSLDNSTKRVFEKIEVDNILINWKKGFHVFEVYYLDFFRDQFKCLNHSPAIKK